VKWRSACTIRRHEDPDRCADAGLRQPEAQTTVHPLDKIRKLQRHSRSTTSWHRLKDRGVRFGVEQFYEPQQLESARQVLQELLEEKGRKGQEVKTAVKQVPPDRSK